MTIIEYFSVTLTFACALFALWLIVNYIVGLTKENQNKKVETDVHVPTKESYHKIEDRSQRKKKISNKKTIKKEEKRQVIKEKTKAKKVEFVQRQKYEGIQRQQKLIIEEEKAQQQLKKERIHKKLKEIEKYNLEKQVQKSSKKTIVKEIDSSTDSTQDRSIIRVNYQTNFLENSNFYPIIKVPTYNCLVQNHKIGSIKRAGFKDESFKLVLEKHFSKYFTVSSNTRLNIEDTVKSFEPDIAMIDNYSGKNIRIDIEIDEPYTGITREAIHCAEDDTYRNDFFNERGWIVIRFSEHQVHTMEMSCVKFIAELIKSINPDFVISKIISNAPEIKMEKQWDSLQAQKWEGENYRENYLNHKFNKTREVLGFSPKSSGKHSNKKDDKIKLQTQTQTQKNDNIRYLPYRKKDKWYFYDLVKEKMLEPSFDFIRIIDEDFGICEAKRNGKEGLIELYGLTYCISLDAGYNINYYGGESINNCIQVSKDGKSGLFDLSKKVILFMTDNKEYYNIVKRDYSNNSTSSIKTNSEEESFAWKTHEKKLYFNNYLVYERNCSLGMFCDSTKKFPSLFEIDFDVGGYCHGFFIGYLDEYGRMYWDE